MILLILVFGICGLLFYTLFCGTNSSKKEVTVILEDTKRKKGKLIHINYADQAYYSSQKLSTKSANEIGGFQFTKSFGRKDLDSTFQAKNKAILNIGRGAGLWLWKPYVINKTLEQTEENDQIWYSDSGSHWTAPVQPYLEVLDRLQADVMLFELSGDSLTDENYSKPTARKKMGCVQDFCTKTRQILGSFILCRNSVQSKEFIGKWLELAQNPALIQDGDNFHTHRHDQSLLSMLAKVPGNLEKYKIIVMPDPSQWGVNERIESLPQVLEHTRNRN